MKLYQALKKKNILTSAIKDNYEKIIQHNSHLIGKQAYNVLEILEQNLVLIEILVELKIKIASANIPINGKIYIISELKNQISQLKHIRIIEGVVEASRYSTDVSGEFTSQFTHKEKDTLMSTAKDKISVLQEEIDAFNIKTII